MEKTSSRRPLFPFFYKKFIFFIHLKKKKFTSGNNILWNVSENEGVATAWHLHSPTYIMEANRLYAVLLFVVL